MANESARASMKGDGKVNFMTHLETFKKLLAAGHQQRRVFETHVNQLGISYSQFNRYVNQYISEKNNDGYQKESHKQSQQQTPATVPTTGIDKQPAENPVAADSSTEKPARAGKKEAVLQHDPNRGNKLDDLV
jgi:hypothetical protein